MNTQVMDIPHKIAELSDILSYQNKAVIARFRKNFDVSQEEAQEIFQETLKWMWLSTKASNPLEEGEAIEDFPMLDKLAILDEMWHNFILFTADYARFCKTYFGRYMHHAPNEDLLLNPAHESRMSLDYFRSLAGYVYDHLGEETTLLWFEVYPEKYSLEAMTNLRKPY